MSIHRNSLIFLALLPTALASADASDGTADFEQTVRGYTQNIEDLKDYRSESLDERWPITGCHAALKSAAAQGITITDAHTAMCKEFVAWHQLAEAEAALTDAA